MDAPPDWRWGPTGPPPPSDAAPFASQAPPREVVRCLPQVRQARHPLRAPGCVLLFSSGAGCHAGRKASDAKWLELLQLLAHGIQEISSSSLLVHAGKSMTGCMVGASPLMHPASCWGREAQREGPPRDPLSRPGGVTLHCPMWTIQPVQKVGGSCCGTC